MLEEPDDEAPATFYGQTDQALKDIEAWARTIGETAKELGRPYPDASGLVTWDGHVEFVFQWNPGRITAKFDQNGPKSIRATKSLDWWPDGTFNP